METRERTAWEPFEVEGWRIPSRWPERACVFILGALTGAALTVLWALQ